jgi:hypothetical protein
MLQKDKEGNVTFGERWHTAFSPRSGKTVLARKIQEEFQRVYPDAVVHILDSKKLGSGDSLIGRHIPTTITSSPTYFYFSMEKTNAEN